MTAGLWRKRVNKLIQIQIQLNLGAALNFHATLIIFCYHENSIRVN
jgi:hypothetical protein